jgi:hypothetical protein
MFLLSSGSENWLFQQGLIPGILSRLGNVISSGTIENIVFHYMKEDFG